jgi:hypothetical protein
MSLFSLRDFGILKKNYQKISKSPDTSDLDFFDDPIFEQIQIDGEM